VTITGIATIRTALRRIHRVIVKASTAEPLLGISDLTPPRSDLG
jgi:hypothetical protein